MESLRRGLALGFGLLLLVPLAGGAVGNVASAELTVAEWLAAEARGELPAACPLGVTTLDQAPPGFAGLPGPGDEDAANPLDDCASGIRPGARLSNGCTMNFVFTDGAGLFVGTAGHCTSSIGQRMSTPGIGQFGSVVYRVNGGIGTDFALIRIDASQVANVDSQMCVWGGPTQAHDGSAQGGKVLFHYGWGILTNSNQFSRIRAHVLGSQGANSANWVGVGSGGDSGSPVITSDGEAFAILTHGATPTASPILFGTTIQRAMGLARAAGFDVQVVGAGFPITPLG